MKNNFTCFPVRASWCTVGNDGRSIYHGKIISDCTFSCKQWECKHTHRSRKAAVNCAKRRLK